MEYLMNRYREDTGSHRSSKQEQVVMKHAIGILRAAGMHADTGERFRACMYCSIHNVGLFWLRTQCQPITSVSDP